MAETRYRRPIGEWLGEEIAPGDSRDLNLAVGESYSGMTVQIPIHVRRAVDEGPVVFVTGALHGNELNGTGAIRQLILDPNLRLIRGSLILIPVLNMLAFDRHTRYLPDRRDLNRSFPGTVSGSLAGRMARIIFDEIVSRADYGIDLHTAAIHRTNYPNVRGDLSSSKIRALAKSFGSEIIINGKGPAGSLRREATKAGCPTIIMEGGEVAKVEPGIVSAATRGVMNVLRNLRMVDGQMEEPDFQITIQKSTWVRAERGGFMRFHIKPGDIVEKNQPLATNTSLLGRVQGTLAAPFDAIVIGMSSLPSLSPGEPVFNLGRLPRGRKPADLRARRIHVNGLEQRISNELASNILVVQPHDGRVAPLDDASADTVQKPSERVDTTSVTNALDDTAPGERPTQHKESSDSS